MALVAFFAGREQNLNKDIDDLQLQDEKISEEEQALSSYATAIADGTISQDTYSSADPSVFSQIQQYQKNSSAIYNAQLQNANAYAGQQGLTGTSGSVWAQQMANAAKQKYTQACQEAIAKKEEELQKKKIAIETQIQQKQTELKAVQDAKGKGIEANTPKYA